MQLPLLLKIGELISRVEHFRFLEGLGLKTGFSIFDKMSVFGFFFSYFRFKSAKIPKFGLRCHRFSQTQINFVQPLLIREK